MNNIAIVVADAEFGRSLAAQLAADDPAVAVLAGHDAGGALDLVRATPIDLLVVDSEWDAGLGGFALLLVAAAYRPQTFVIVRTAEPRPGGEIQCGIGWAAADIDRLDSLSERVREAALARARGAVGVGGVTLARLIEAAHHLGWSGALGIRSGRSSGIVLLRTGTLFHATFDGRSGVDALGAALALGGGTISECDPPVDSPQTIHDDTLVALAAATEAARTLEHAVEVTDGDVIDFFEVSDAEPAGAAFELFSADELAQLALDDAMAEPVVKARPR